MVAESPAESFTAQVDARPVLKFRDFTGPIEMKAAVSPDCSYELVRNALGEAGRDSNVDAYIYSISAPHLMALLKGARDRGATVRVMYDPAQMRAADGRSYAVSGSMFELLRVHDPRRVFTVCSSEIRRDRPQACCLESANWANTSNY